MEGRGEIILNWNKVRLKPVGNNIIYSHVVVT